MQGSIKPGDIIHYDFRTPSSSTSTDMETLNIMQFNIERGYKLEEIIRVIQAQNPDIILLEVSFLNLFILHFVHLLYSVILLQEIDIGNERSGNLDTGKIIAERLEMNYLFVCEFEEFRSPLRVPHTQGGGFHGNGILSYFSLLLLLFFFFFFFSFFFFFFFFFSFLLSFFFFFLLSIL